MNLFFFFDTKWWEREREVSKRKTIRGKILEKVWMSELIRRKSSRFCSISSSIFSPLDRCLSLSILFFLYLSENFLHHHHLTPKFSTSSSSSLVLIEEERKLLLIHFRAFDSKLYRKKKNLIENPIDRSRENWEEFLISYRRERIGIKINFPPPKQTHFSLEHFRSGLVSLS